MNENRKREQEMEKRLKAAKYSYRSGNGCRRAGFDKHPGYTWRRLRERT